MRIIIHALSEKGVKMMFVWQPELSTSGLPGKLLLASDAYFAETECEFISMRTKDGLKVAKPVMHTISPFIAIIQYTMRVRRLLCYKKKLYRLLLILTIQSGTIRVESKYGPMDVAE